MRIISAIKFFLQDSKSVGILLLCCTVISLIASNSAIAPTYTAFWQQTISISISPIEMPETLIHLVNDLLMSVFFFSAGLEIKKELTIGQLNTFKRGLMPLISATGGMLVPAAIYIIWCHGETNYMGWGIPMATDIAFSLGVLSLLGSRVPLSLKIFLTAIAIIDDIGGIVTIAIFYAGRLNWHALVMAIAVIIILLGARVTKRTHLSIYLFCGMLLWYFIYHSGIHATIAGVILAFLIPTKYSYKLERLLRIPINFVILPLFALANTAIELPADIMPVINNRIQYAVLTGLAIGKPLGIYLSTLLAHKLKIAAMPASIDKKHLLGMGMVAGVGFTVSMFIATLAFNDTQTQTVAKVGVILASLVSGIAGYLYLRLASKKRVRLKADSELS